MKYIVENWDTCETIAEFETEEQRQIWIDNYAPDGMTADGIKISIYEF